MPSAVDQWCWSGPIWRAPCLATLSTSCCNCMHTKHTSLDRRLVAERLRPLSSILTSSRETAVRNSAADVAVARCHASATWIMHFNEHVLRILTRDNVLGDKVAEDGSRKEKDCLHLLIFTVLLGTSHTSSLFFSSVLLHSASHHGPS